MIRLAIVDKYPVICDALESLVSNAADVETVACKQSLDELAEYLHHDLVHVALVVIYSPYEQSIDEIKALMHNFSRLKLLVLSMYSNEEFILKLIKAGVQGHLGPDTDRSEILEAIYTLRNGYEFHAKTITNILLKNYISDQNIDKQEKEKRQKQLSPREMEVFKLFAEGLSNRAIADKLFISVRTVETHKNNIMKKVNLKTTVDMVKFAIKNNIIELD